MERAQTTIRLKLRTKRRAVSAAKASGVSFTEFVAEAVEEKILTGKKRPRSKKRDMIRLPVAGQRSRKISQASLDRAVQQQLKSDDLNQLGI